MYDITLGAALKMQKCGPAKLTVEGEWAWLLAKFTSTYGVCRSYMTLAHLRWVMRCGALAAHADSSSQNSARFRCKCGVVAFIAESHEVPRLMFWDALVVLSKAARGVQKFPIYMSPAGPSNLGCFVTVYRQNSVNMPG